MNQSIKRIAIVGPECTGKSSLAKRLAMHFQTNWVPEYAREYLDQLQRPYVQGDLLSIAQGQLKAEETISLQTKDILICDTNLIVIKVWSEFKYGCCDASLLQLLHSRSYDLHLLTHPDIPWEMDPQREHPHHRKELFSFYKQELETLNVRYVNIFGDYESRFTMALQAIHDLSQS